MFIRQIRQMRGTSALAIIVMIAGCAYFDGLEKETLARLIKEQPKTEQELAQSVGYAVGEKKVVKVPMVAHPYSVQNPHSVHIS